MGFGREQVVMKSLAAVDTWMAALNDNMQGVSKNGYRAKQVTFGGSGEPLIAREATDTLLNIQRTDQTLSIIDDSIDFSAGFINASYENTHFAIQDKDNRFFVVVNKDEAVTSGAGGTLQLNTPRSTTTHGGVYLTRDGEFHWGPPEDIGDGNSCYYLKDKYGNYVARSNANVANGIALFYNGGTSTEVVRWDPASNNNQPPPEINSGSGNSLTPGVADIDPDYLQTLERSLKFGSATFLFPPGSTTNADGIIDTGTSLDNGFLDDTLLTYSLESANVDMARLVPELTLAQKMYQSLTKVLQAYQTNLDNAFNIIR